MNSETTQYGFKWGSATIERLCSDEKKGWVYLAVSSPKAIIELYVTKSGKIRVYEKKRKGVWAAAPKELTGR